MSGSATPPQPANPINTATTQQQFNTSAAEQNQAGSAVNQFNPFGSLTYQQTGTGPGGIPLFSSSVNLSPQQQGLLDTLTGTQQSAGNAGQSLINGANYGGSTPTQAIGTESSGIQGGLMSQWLQSQEPWLNQQAQQEDTQLRNQGIFPSPTATSDPSTWGPYERQMNQIQQSQDMAVAGAASQFQPQAFNEASSLYTLPAQLGLQFAQFGQPTSPTSSLVQTPAFNTTSPDFTGATEAANQEQMQAFIAQQQLQGSLMSGLFGAGGTILGGLAKNPGIFAALGA